MKKTIFHMVRGYEPSGGAENVYLDYCKILKDDFNIVCLVNDKFVHLDKIKKLGIKTYTLRYRGKYDFISVIKFFFLAKKYSPDLVLAHSPRAFYVINSYKKLFKNSKFKTVAISHCKDFKGKFKLNYIITVAKHLADFIKREYKKFPPSNILIIHNGTKLNYDYNPSSKVENTNFTFGMLSRLSPEKNIITALRAFKMFLKDVPNAKLKIAGDGLELENLKNFVEKENLQNNVDFLGRINNIEEFFDNIELLLHPSIEEPFGLVIIEGFNYYTPVIGSASGGLKEIIVHEKNGFLYENPTSEQNLYKAMHKYYFEDIKNKDKIVAQARKDLEEKFSLEVAKKNLISTLNQIVEEA